ncbi:hypothetical protein D3C86_1913200 [compost metagenome]
MLNIDIVIINIKQAVRPLIVQIFCLLLKKPLNESIASSAPENIESAESINGPSKIS